MAIGAFLTQNTSWGNVELAIGNLRTAEALSVASLAEIELSRLEELIRPAGYFRQKAARLQGFVRYLQLHWDGCLETMLAQPLALARVELLSLHGICPETADSILLYAGGQPSFVVDAYTRRILARLGRLPGAGNYAEMRDLFMARLPQDAELFNEYHALIVLLAKQFCRKRQPRCPPCPLETLCPKLI